MKKTIIILALIAASSLSQAATLNADSTYDLSIDSGSCFAIVLDCTAVTFDNPNNVLSGAVISIATTSDGAGGVNFTVASATDLQYTGTGFGAFTLSETGGTGQIDAAGNISYTPTGRLGYAEAIPFLGQLAWNINDSAAPNAAPEYASFTSGTQSNFISPITGEWEQFLTLSGSALDDNLSATIVSVNNIGTAWDGVTLSGVPYAEVWNIAFTDTTYIPPPENIPVPAAVWLFGSGLFVLLGVSRRRRYN